MIFDRPDMKPSCLLLIRPPSFKNMANFTGARFSIDTTRHSGTVQFVEHDLMFYERVDFYDRERLVVDTFGPSWLLGWTEFDPDQICPVSGDREVSLWGQYFVFIPSYTLIYWKINPGTLHWNAMVSSTPLNGITWKQPLLIKSKGTPNLSSKEAVARFLLNHAQPSEGSLFLEPQMAHSRVSRLAKNYIDQHYREEMTIAELANRFGQHHVVLTRNFTKAYGISPIKYRQRVRLFEAMNLMNHGASVTEAIFASGFTNLSEFNRQFKATLSTNPKSFSPNHQQR